MAIVNVEEDAGTLAVSVAERIASLLLSAGERFADVRLCLTGGQTPRATYELLARGLWADRPSPIDWSRVHLFWGDERAVPPDHPDSNFGMAGAALIDPAGVPAANVHRMRGELPADEAAREYDDLLRRFTRPAGEPLFDVMLLGLGADAHIASIFPGSPLLGSSADGQLVSAVWAPSLNTWRITLTPSALLDASAIVVVTAGASKAAAVYAALAQRDDVTRVPAQLLRGAAERVEWWIDREAARYL